MAFIRRVRTASGATAVQIAEYIRGQQRIVEHVGSAHTQAELGVLLERARELLADPAQGVLDVGVEPTPTAEGLLSPAGDPGLFEPAAPPPRRPQRPAAARGRWPARTRGSCSGRSRTCTRTWGSRSSATRCSGTW